MPIKPRSAKNKGKKLQNEVADDLRKVYFAVLEYLDIKSRTMGEQGQDIELSPLGQKTIKLNLEIKKTRKHPGIAEMKQARSNSTPGSLPAVIWSPHGSNFDSAMITFNYKEFIRVWSKINEKEE